MSDDTALDLARRFAHTDPDIKLMSVSNPVEMILTLMHQRWVLAREVVKLYSELKQLQPGGPAVAKV